MRICLLVLCSAFLFKSGYGQVPGYTGRRTPVSLDIHFFPTLGQYFLREESLGLNARLGLEMEHVISRKSSIGISINHFSTNSTYAYDGRSGNMKLQGWILGVNFRAYRFRRRGNIAPLGMYLKPQFNLLRYYMTDQDHNFFTNGQKKLGQYYDLSLGFTYGTQRMLSDQLFYNIGLQGAWLINAFNQQETVEKQYLKQRGSSRLREFLSLTVQAGLGVLLF